MHEGKAESSESETDPSAQDGIRHRPGSLAEARSMALGYPRYSSCSATIDKLLEGGYLGGTVTEIFGGSNTGKTQLAMQAALSAARVGARALFVDTEGGFRPERVEGMAQARGLDSRRILASIVYFRATDSTQQMEVIRRLERDEETATSRLVVIDTLTANFSLDYPGDRNMPRRQGTLDVHLSEIARDAFLSGRAYLLTNRVYSSQGRSEAHVGGRTVSQLVHNSIHLSREGQRKGTVSATLIGEPNRKGISTIGPAGFE